jgi:hypothetical protein
MLDIRVSVRRIVVIVAVLLAAIVPMTRKAGAANPVIAATPYMGWSSWSLESTNYPGIGGETWLTEQHVLQQADVMAAKLKSHGYDYVNIDAGWQDGVDAYGRPKAKASAFPDGIKYIADYVHRKGLKLGIYTVVGLGQDAYNGGNTPIYGTTNCHTSDIVYPDLRTTNGWNSAYKIDYSSPCAQAYANSIADEFASWGVDFVKMDGVGPGSFQGGPNFDNTSDIAAWSAALKQTGRPIQYVISWALSHNDAPVWKQNTNGWRIDTDVECYCNTLVTWDASVKQRWNDVVQWIPDAGPGHWNNLDSLDVGNGAMDGITDTERQSYMTLWAIESAPLFSGDDLTRLDTYGLSLLTNDEVIAVDQAGNPARPVSQTTNQQVWYARNRDGSYTVALFNLDGSPASVTANWQDLGFTDSAGVRDLWSHRNLGSFGNFTATLPAHGSRLLRVTPHNPGLSIPTGLHGAAATASGISLAWTGSAQQYDVYIDGRRVSTVSTTSATVSGLQSGTTHTFTVVARDRKTRSVPSSPITVTTTDSGGPVSIEAEAPANTVGGGATIASCSGCSGGEKVGYLGGSGYLTMNNVHRDHAGTYLMTISYVDGDSSRTINVTVDGKQIDVPLSGTNDNDWNAVHQQTIAVPLAAGDNSIRFDNPGGYAPDIDKIVV